MKYTLLTILSILSINWGLYAQNLEFKVSALNVDCYLNKEGYFDVVEQYDMYFFVEKHGIYRNFITIDHIQLEEVKKKSQKFFITKVAVEGFPFEATSLVEQRVQDYVTIRIGDPNKLISGAQKITLSYRVKDAFIMTDSQAIFYWNIKSSEWNTKFEKVNFNIHLPEGYESDLSNFFIYSGATNSPFDSQDFEVEYENGIIKATSKPGVSYSVDENVTVLLKMPRTVIQKSFFKEYLWIFLSLFLGLIIFLIERRKEKLPPLITAYYPPEDMDPALAGALIDDTADQRDLVSLLPFWASKGWIQIEEFEKDGSIDVRLIKLMDLPQESPDYQSLLFKELFYKGDIVHTSDLKDNKDLNLHSVAYQIESKIKTLYYDKAENDSRMNRVMFYCFIMAVFCFALFWFFGIGPSLLSGTFFLVLVGYFFFRDIKSKRGKIAYAELLGFKKFIQMAEVSRIQTLLEQDAQYFEKTMSYAVAFDLLSVWTKKFEGLNLQYPDWYQKNQHQHEENKKTFAQSFQEHLMKIQPLFIIPKPKSVSSSSSKSSSGSQKSYSYGSSTSSGGGASGGGLGKGGGGAW